MRKKVIAGNWKMNKDLHQSQKLVSEIINGLGKDNKADVIVFNRGMADGHPELGPGKRILWAHDLPHIGFCPNPQRMNSLTCLVSMSQYADRVWREMFDSSKAKFEIS